METAKLFHIIIIHVTVITEYGSSNDWKIFCYFNAKARHREPSIRFDTFNIDFSLCTHYVYAYAKIYPPSLAIVPYDPLAELKDTGTFKNFTGKNLDTRRKAKTLLSIGGPDASAHAALVEITKSVANISTFANNAVHFLRWFGFDGLDIDWQYPTNIAMKAGLIHLLKELREIFDQDTKGERLLLTVKCPGVYSSDGYDVPFIARYADYVIIAAYNLTTPDPTKAWFGSPLYSMPITVDSSVREWLQTGLPASKTVVGITGVGRYLLLANAAINKPGSPLGKHIVAGPIFKIPNGLAYPEICQAYNPANYFDNATQMHYMRVRITWIGYEDSESIKAKITWMKDLYLAGVMFAELDMDDFTGTKCHRGQFYLTKTVKKWSDIIPTMKAPVENETTTTTTISITTTVIDDPTKITTPPLGTIQNQKTGTTNSFLSSTFIAILIPICLILLCVAISMCVCRSRKHASLQVVTKIDPQAGPE